MVPIWLPKAPNTGAGEQLKVFHVVMKPWTNKNFSRHLHLAGRLCPGRKTKTMQKLHCKKLHDLPKCPEGSYMLAEPCYHM